MSNEFFKVKKGLHITPSTQPADPQIGDLIIDSSDNNKLKRYDGTAWKEAGGGQGGINYITAYSAEDGTVGWAVYKDAAGTSPVDGTGTISSPASSFVNSFNSTYALRGGYGFVFTKPASNCQGEGFSYDFTIDPADQAKMLRCTFDYKYAGTYADDDLQIWILDVTNNTLIQPTPFKLKNHTMYSEQYAFEFQAAYNSTSYRLIFHVASTSTSLFYFAFDNIQLGPQVARGFGSNITDEVDKGVITFGATTTAPTKGTTSADSVKMSKLGDKAFLVYNYKQLNNGTNGSGDYLLSLPSGMSFDPAKVTYYTGAHVYGATLAPYGLGSVYMSWTDNASVGTNAFGKVIPYDATRFRVSLEYVTSAGAVGAGGGFWSSSYNSLGYSGTSYTSANIEFTAAISGWSAQSQIISTDAAQGVVAGKVALSSTTTFNNTTIVYDTVIMDKQGCFSGGVYTVKTPGTYVLHAQGQSISTTMGVLLYKGATNLARSYQTSTANDDYANCWTITDAIAGDTFYVKTDGNYSVYGATVDNYFEVFMLQGPSQILASADVSARYKTSAGQSIAGSTATIIDFGTKDYDSNGSITTGASWKFTAPVAGIYEVSTAVLFNTASFTGTNSIELRLFKNGSLYSIVDRLTINSTATTYFGTSGSGKIRLIAGDYIDIRVQHTEGSNRSLYADDTYNWIEVTKVGNY
jgi:hypothetical protein